MGVNNIVRYKAWLENYYLHVDTPGSSLGEHYLRAKWFPFLTVILRIFLTNN